MRRVWVFGLIALLVVAAGVYWRHEHRLQHSYQWTGKNLPSPPFSTSGGTWPVYTVKPEWVSDLQDRFESPNGEFGDDSYKAYTSNYSTFGDYLNFSKLRFANDGEIVIEDGLPRVQYKGKVYSNPVTLAHFALSMYGRYIAGDATAKSLFFKAADELIKLQSSDGGFYYLIEFDHKGRILPAGWGSGMAQGNALSVFARAFRLSGDTIYRVAGERAFALLMKPMDAGGLRASLGDLNPSLSGYVFFPEYPVRPVDYTLNGYIFAMLGVYDWSQVGSPSQREAAQTFSASLATLSRVIPYYNVAGYSAYDLEHVTVGTKPFVPISYVARHVYLLHAINSISDDSTLRYYEKLWTAKLDYVSALVRVRTITQSTTEVEVGKPVTFTVTASGGINISKLYQFWVLENGKWYLAKDYSDQRVFTWTPKAPGSYRISAYVKDYNSPHDPDSARSIAVVVAPHADRKTVGHNG